MKTLVLGSNGQLGRALVAQLGDAAVGLDIDELDITDRRAALQTIGALAPGAIVNCAAYTAVDKAETDAATCRQVNATAVGTLADAAAAADCPLVQISTDYVFGGDTEQRTPYRETDPPVPQSAYARAKLEGERLAAGHIKHFVVRTCGLYGAAPTGGNFVKTMLRIGQDGESIRVVADQTCTPTYVEHLAQAVCFLLRTDAYGLYHIVNRGQTNWAEFARAIFAALDRDVKVVSITTREYAAEARRPRYSVLSTAKYAALAGPEMPEWQQALETYLATLATQTAVG
jgi:dTDP-4-dehydrorhamnose reductase